LQVNYPQDIAYVTQTTLSVDDTLAIIQALQSRFPGIVGPRHDDICYATQNRQDAVKELSGRVDLLLVVGSVNSSNSNRLRELAEKRGVPSYLIDGADDILDEWLEGVSSIGVTAGASAPESLVREVIVRLQEKGGKTVEELKCIPESMEFALPRELRINLLNSA
jgi:4-hydroxy-3-methylbut-2-enyl diphosphate reductase